MHKVSTVGELKALIKGIPDWVPVGFIERHGPDPYAGEYDDYCGMPTGKLTSVYVNDGKREGSRWLEVDTL